MIDKARDIALQTLYKIDIEGAYSNIILDEMIRKNRNNLGEKDIGLISEIVYGVTTWKLTLDEIVKKYSKIKIKKIAPMGDPVDIELRGYELAIRKKDLKDIEGIVL